MADIQATFWQTFIQQAPGIAGILAAIVLFLRYGISPLLAYLSEMEKRRAESDAIWQKFLSEQAEQTRTSMMALSGQVAGALERMNAEMSAQNDAIRALSREIAVHSARAESQKKNRNG